MKTNYYDIVFAGTLLTSYYLQNTTKS